MFILYLLMISKKELWNKWEMIATKWLLDKWRTILKCNYTIRWWEIDIIAENDEFLLCVEVKTISDLDNFSWYVSDKKISHLIYTFESFMWRFYTNKQPRIDVIYVTNDKVRKVFENITWE